MDESTHGIHNSYTRLAFPSQITLSCPPTSHTVKQMFLYSTVSTLNPVREGDTARGNEQTCVTDRRNGGNDLSQFQFVQNRRFTRGVQPDLVHSGYANEQTDAWALP